MINIYTKTHQIVPFKKKFIGGGACPRTPLAKRMASPCAACRFATCKFPNLKKKILGPPPAKSWGRPWLFICQINHYHTIPYHVPTMSLPCIYNVLSCPYHMSVMAYLIWWCNYSPTFICFVRVVTWIPGGGEFLVCGYCSTPRNVNWNIHVHVHVCQSNVRMICKSYALACKLLSNFGCGFLKMYLILFFKNCKRPQ